MAIIRELLPKTRTIISKIVYNQNLSTKQKSILEKVLNTILNIKNIKLSTKV